MHFTRQLFSQVASGIVLVAGSFLMSAPSYAGGASSTCINWSGSGAGPIDGSMNSITAQCKNTAGAYVQTAKWLPGCVGNRNGSLVWAKDGYFDRSCKSCWLPAIGMTIDGKVDYGMNCQCKTISGSWQSTTIRMGDLSNWNGSLVCPI